MHQHIGMRRDQRARAGELRVGGGQREARRDGITKPPAPAPPGDQRLAVGAAAFGRIVKRRGAEIHQHLARDDPHVAGERRLEQRVDRGRMDGGKDQCAGGAVAQQLVQEEAGDFVGMGAVRKRRFGREDMAFEPFEQLRAVRSDPIGLRVMNMRIDEARDDEPGGKMLDRHVGETLGEIGMSTERHDQAILDH